MSTTTSDGRPLYIVATGWRFAGVVAITDDVMFARSLVLQEYESMCGPMSSERFACFEELFKAFLEMKTRMVYFCEGEYSFEIRPNEILLAVGGLSTI